MYVHAQPTFGLAHFPIEYAVSSIPIRCFFLLLLPTLQIRLIVLAEFSCPDLLSEGESFVTTRQLKAQFFYIQHLWTLVSTAQESIHDEAAPEGPTFYFTVDEVILLLRRVVAVCVAVVLLRFVKLVSKTLRASHGNTDGVPSLFALQFGPFMIS
jgi:hypothetical protein